MSLKSQARVLVRDNHVRGRGACVVEPPIRPRRILRSFAQRVAKLVEDQLRDRVVDIEVLVGRDQQAPRAIAGRVSIAGSLDPQPNFLGGRNPNTLDIRAREGA